MMNRRFANSVLVAAALAATLATACIGIPTASGSFEKTLAVTGPVRLEVRNGSGSVEIRTGPADQVRVHGEFHAMTWLWEIGENPHHRVEDLTKNPPIEQSGGLVRVGYESERLRNVHINYTIVVPPETELRSTSGSGNVEVRGIRGPAQLTIGSGSITAEQIGDDAEATAGSGKIHLADVKGEAHVTAGSGSLTLENVHGQVRATTGSGNITIDRPGDRVTAKAGSGRIQVQGAAADLRIATGSGRITVEGNPAPNSYWELHTGSGGIDLDVPSNASFRLYARSRSGHIETDLPIVIEEQTRRELRARVGQGQARVELESGSGSVRLH